MASTSYARDIEGQHASRPPFFNGSNYGYWKCRMAIFLKSIDFAVWKIVEHPYTSPSADYSLWSDEEKKMANLNAKAMNALYCAIDQNEFNRISICESAYDIWHSLEVIHEGTNKVKEAKISSLVRKYELFKMNKDEPITEMFTRFTNITNDLKSLGVTYSQTDKVKKILRSLTTDWEKKTTAIEEAQDLSKLTLDDLIGNLMAYEVHMKERREEEQPTKKTLAFPALSENEDSEKESEIALLTRKFQRFMRKNRLPNKHKERKDPKEDSMCYQCNKPGHLRRDCPLLKRKSKTEEPKKRFFKKKALHAQWDDSEPSTSEESSDDEAETANMCFMAESSVSESLDFSFEELQNAFQELFEESRKTILKNKHLKSENLELMLKNEKLSIENSELQKKNL